MQIGYSTRRWTIAILLLLFPATSLSQTSSASREERVRAARNRIAALSRTLEAADVETPSQKAWREACRNEGCDAARRESPNIEVLIEQDWARQRAAADRVAVQIEGEVDGYVSTLDATKVDTNAILQDLQEILMPLGELTETLPFASTWNPDSIPQETHCNVSRSLSGGVPRPSGRSLILAFRIYKGRNQSAATLRGYRTTNGHFVLADVTAQDFEHYGRVSTRELYSYRTSPCDPAQHAWFLMMGQDNSANGPNIRLRAFSFDGRKFQTVWMPENTWGSWKITVKDGGFVVEGNWYRGGPRHDEYLVTDDGFDRR